MSRSDPNCSYIRRTESCSQRTPGNVVWNARQCSLEVRQCSLAARPCYLEVRQCSLQARKCSLEVRQWTMEARKCSWKARQCFLEAKQCPWMPGNAPWMPGTVPWKAGSVPGMPGNVHAMFPTGQAMFPCNISKPNRTLTLTLMHLPEQMTRSRNGCSEMGPIMPHSLINYSRS